MGRKSQVLSQWVTTTQAAKILSRTPHLVRHMINNGEIKGELFGDRWIVNLESLLAYQKRIEAMTEAEKRNPWRKDLVDKGRGRKRKNGKGDENAKQ